MATYLHMLVDSALRGVVWLAVLSRGYAIFFGATSGNGSLFESLHISERSARNMLGASAPAPDVPNSASAALPSMQLKAK